MWEKLKATGKPILLYGMGDGAEKIAAELKKREIPIAGVFASEGFTRGQEFMEMCIRDRSSSSSGHGWG